MVETSTKIRNKQKQMWRKILTHVSELSCCHLNLVLPLAVMQNINMCMCARACVWQHRHFCMYKANTQ